ncbi:uncharacterized protein LOC795315 isoform 1 precursor [Danio rerio]|uniref:Si:dkey-96g2.1 n=1 Tax=Danio rerio TaxID=7955 RepID=X1WGQ3_DANRE|nr:uncharacterized protein LOC795315 isoform 1 precursor [Danio rerio]|eukprot:XP_005157870.1 uncharacterized protein si:dkey-96g2.1 isoform X1 [Danio rerio]
MANFNPASLKGLFIIFLLHLCVQHARGDVNPAALAKMIQYFDENVQPKTKPDVQYAIAIVVPQALCTDEQSDIQTVFSTEEAAHVKDLLTNGQTCVLCTNSQNVIAARPTQKPKEHAEHILLYPLSNSPMDKLLAKADPNSCVVFYSYNSPCVTKCIQSTDNILAGLANWKNIRKDAMNVFVFGKIWQKDAWRKDMAKDLLMIYDQVPLYRCDSSNGMQCKNCVEKNTKIVDSFCLPKRKSMRLYFQKMLLSLLKG